MSVGAPALSLERFCLQGIWKWRLLWHFKGMLSWIHKSNGQSSLKENFDWPLLRKLSIVLAPAQVRVCDQTILVGYFWSPSLSGIFCPPWARQVYCVAPFSFRTPSCSLAWQAQVCVRRQGTVPTSEPLCCGLSWHGGQHFLCLMVMDSFSVCVSENIFAMPSVLKALFTGYKNLRR